MSDNEDDDDDLFEWAKKRRRPSKRGAYARNTDPDTAHEAADTVDVSKLEALFLLALRDHGTLTTTEIANVYGMDRDSFSPRARPLINKKLILSDGKRPCLNSAGKTRSMLAFRLRKE